MLHRLARRSALLAFVALGVAGPAAAQQPAATPAPAPAPPAVAIGQLAPDFTLPAATRYGVLSGPTRLSDFRGQTVIVAFFPRARSKG